ncbi:hypothetical protein P9112_000299 [Eukaryota sp. TZLM1-RC]
MSSFITPHRYNAFFDPNFSTFEYDVMVTIECSTSQSTTSLTFHQLDLTVTKQPTIEVGSTSATLDCTSSTNNDQETLTITLPEEIPPSDLTITLSCKGVLNDQMVGFYKSSYMHDGEKRWIATTQHEAVDCRRTFPCIDDPGRKAKFNISCTAPVGFTALSNMPVKYHEARQDHQYFEFEELPPMATYLFALVIGQFDYIEDTFSDGKPVRVYCRKGDCSRAKFGLEMAKKSLEWFEDFLGIPYYLPKMDLVAIPDFSFGAMENSGLVTYRDTCLLVEPESPSIQSLQRVAMVISHENAHQWFGNLVTLSSFKYLYLNEAFAEYLGYLCTSSLFPEWDYMSQAVSETTIPGMKLDSLENTHSIEVELDHPRQIDEIFDHVTYLKGAGLVRMISSFMGEDKFQESLRQYLAKFQWGNTISSDLWSVFAEVSGIEELESIMNGWVHQKGYPLIKVSKLTHRMCLRQEPFCLTLEKQLWHVPLQISVFDRSGTLVETRSLVFKDSLTLFDFSGYDDHVFVVNPDKASFVRVEYAPDLNQQLLTSLDFLSPIDLLSLVDDTFYLCKRSARAFSTYVKLVSKILEHVIQSNDVFRFHSTIETITSELLALIGLLPRELLQNHFVQLLKKLLDVIGWTGGSSTAGLVRSSTLLCLVLLEDAEILGQCDEIFKQGSINSELKTPIYTAFGLHSMENFEQLIQMVSDSKNDSIEVSRLLRSIGYSANTSEKLEKAWEFGLSDGVRRQDWIILTRGLGQRSGAQKYLWGKFSEKFDELVKTIPSSLLSSAFSSLFEGLSDFDVIEEVKAFFSARNLPSMKFTIPQVIENASQNAQFVDSVRLD